MEMEIWYWTRERVEVEAEVVAEAEVHLAPAQQDQLAIILMKKKMVKTQPIHPHHMKKQKSNLLLSLFLHQSTFNLLLFLGKSSVS